MPSSVLRNKRIYARNEEVNDKHTRASSKSLPCSSWDQLPWSMAATVRLAIKSTLNCLYKLIAARNIRNSQEVPCKDSEKRTLCCASGSWKVSGVGKHPPVSAPWQSPHSYKFKISFLTQKKHTCHLLQCSGQPEGDAASHAEL